MAELKGYLVAPVAESQLDGSRIPDAVSRGTRANSVHVVHHPAFHTGIHRSIGVSPEDEAPLSKGALLDTRIIVHCIPRLVDRT